MGWRKEASELVCVLMEKPETCVGDLLVELFAGGFEGLGCGLFAGAMGGALSAMGKDFF